jgi:micrococcal nuclease
MTEQKNKDTGQTGDRSVPVAEKGVSRASPSPDLFLYRAKPMATSRHSLGVIDGDTLDLTIDLGFRLYTDTRVRLIDVDTPEMRKDTGDGKYYKDLCHRWIASRIHRDSWPFVIETKKADSFGRWIARVLDLDGSDLSQYLIAEGAPRYVSKKAQDCGMSPELQRYGWKDLIE